MTTFVDFVRTATARLIVFRFTVIAWAAQSSTQQPRVVRLARHISISLYKMLSRCDLNFLSLFLTRDVRLCSVFAILILAASIVANPLVYVVFSS
jgi:hypothetical protein